MKNNIQKSYAKLSSLTDARIGLGHVGVSLPTKALLNFQLAHGMAQDAVHLPLDKSIFEKLDLPKLFLHSRASNRDIYLQRPDFGKRLDADSIDKIKSINKNSSYDLVIVVADGLSALAIHENACNFIKVLQKQIPSFSLAPLCIVEGGRVAIGDEIGALLNAKAVVVLIGERPGLSSPDSLGLYLTWAPKVGLTDERRNCISNIRKKGLSYEVAVQKTLYLLEASKKLQYSGVNLKDRSDIKDIRQVKSNKKFLKL